MYKIGLKLWSINKQYQTDIIKLYEEEMFNYIELYVKPDSFDDYAEFWKTFDIPFVIHAPHYGDKVNLSLSECFTYNLRMSNQSSKFADVLKSDKIIFHSGVGGKLEETIRQLKLLNDKRIIVENKPRYGQNGENCIGYKPEDLENISEATDYKICLDIGHAICAANSLNIEPFKFIKDFIKLSPIMFHLTDGQFESEKDRHDHYGEGTFPLKELIALIPRNSMITNEAKRDNPDSLDCFRKDVIYLTNQAVK